MVMLIKQTVQSNLNYKEVDRVLESTVSESNTGEGAQNVGEPLIKTINLF